MFTVEILQGSLFPTVLLKDGARGCTAEIFAFGGLLNSFSVATEEGRLETVDGFAGQEAAINEMVPGFKSAFLSPFVCRMDKGAFTFNGKAYQTEKFFLGPHAIHGLVYDSICTVASSGADEDSAWAVLKNEYAFGNIGYPFSYRYEHLWKLGKDNNLSVTTTVVQGNPLAIPYAQGWHPYFKLGNGGIDACSLRFGSQTQVAFDETLLPTGELLADHRFQKGQDLKGIQLDNCFLLDDHGTCTLENQQARLDITPIENYPYLQVYTPPHRQSIAIENLSGAPDCFNNQMGLLHLRPMEPVRFSTVYAITLK